MSEEIAVKADIYDIIIFGATGLTGQYVVDEIAKTIESEKLSWAVAGRNMAKLQKVLEESGNRTGNDLSEMPIVIADVDNYDSLKDMAKQAKVVLNCVGPYRFHGSNVVKACIENCAHYLDVSGEPQFLEKCQLLYSKEAKENNVFIVGSCGFDSIPADLGVVYAQDNFKGILNCVEGYLRIRAGPEGMRGGFATWQSAIHGYAHSKETGLQRKQLYTTPLPKPSHKIVKRDNIFYSDEVGEYCLPFPGSDRSVVYRTQRYNHVLERHPVQFNAYLRLPSMFYAYLTAFVGVIFAFLCSFSFGRYLLESYPSFFSFGVFSKTQPTLEQIEGASFTYKLFGSGYEGSSDDDLQNQSPDGNIVVSVTGPEPGYVTTPICLVQCAYVLLAEKEKLPGECGVYTPGAIFAKTSIIDRLTEKNVKFSIVEK